ncbi:hypothetical protein AB0H37_44425 [Actinomadura sp. NPDC023710]|uniref:hypothetical protein n=1 Tax=Actinomadura sp. NPDC023710 TaxID=3158219 RepID=UPI0033E3325F
MQAEDEPRRIERRYEKLERQRNVVFYFWLAAAALGLALVPTALVLLVLNLITQAVVSGVAGLLCGAAIYPLRVMNANIAGEIAQLDERFKAVKADERHMMMILLAPTHELRLKLMTDFAAGRITGRVAGKRNTAARSRVTRPPKKPRSALEGPGGSADDDPRSEDAKPEDGPAQ